jgi:AcrR family transcriptional regulator
MRDLASSIELQASAVYGYFASKAQLLAELVRVGHEAHHAEIRAAMLDAGADPVAQLRALVRANVGMHTSYPRPAGAGDPRAVRHRRAREPSVDRGGAERDPRLVPASLIPRRRPRPVVAVQVTARIRRPRRASRCTRRSRSDRGAMRNRHQPIRIPKSDGSPHNRVTPRHQITSSDP